MLWIARPPYLQWAAAIVILASVAWIELRPQQTTLHPYLLVDVEVGQAVDSSIEWRSIPSGMLGRTEAVGVAAHSLPAGDPLLASDLSTESHEVPADWWIVELDLPAGAAVGASLQLVLLPEPGQSPRQPISGIVVSTGDTQNAFAGSDRPGSAAFAPLDAAMAAVAIANNRVSVLIRP